MARKVSWSVYLLKEFFFFAPRAIYRLIKPLNDRLPEMVKSSYDRRYLATAENFSKDPMSLNKYLFDYTKDLEWILIDDKVSLGTVPESYKAFVVYLEQYLERYLKMPGATIVEFGCGSGRNLIYLKNKYPGVKFIGIELSPEGVALARLTAKQYNLDIEFIEADLTLPLDLKINADIAFTAFALEQMPHSLSVAIENMSKTSNGKLVLFEPVAELYPWWNLRGLTSRARAIVIDHVRHLIPVLKKSGYKVDEARRLGVGNPLTEAVVVIAHK